jgi:hypothetical protein
MNPSAIVMLVISLTLFLGGIGFCISRVGKNRPVDSSD